MVPHSTADSESDDAGRLAELGYKQELKRDWGLLHNFGTRPASSDGHV